MAPDNIVEIASRRKAPRLPPVPADIRATGVGQNFLEGLMLKSMYVLGLERTPELKHHLKLPDKVLTSLFEEARAKGLMTVGDMSEFMAHVELRFHLTDRGRARAIEALDQSQYIGPAPVSMTDFITQTRAQTIASEQITPDGLAACFGGMSMSRELAEQIGAALNHGHSLLLYGPPGNGKSIYSEAIVRSFAQTVFLPYAIVVDGQVISLFDAAVHEPVADAQAGQPGTDAAYDRRWVHCRRPAVIAGGELTMEMLELVFDPYTKSYEAPLQLKATGGVFIIDDFGRQAVEPARILNRWIVPLERKSDYLALHSGKKVAVPFDELLIFSTNLDPNGFMDAAMMRRIHYKIEIGPPGREEYLAILADECRKADLALPDEIVSFLFDEFYPKGQVQIARFHPKWIIDHIVSSCAYEGIAPSLERDRVAQAMENLFVPKTPPAGA
jgi:hypothetical protein